MSDEPRGPIQPASFEPLAAGGPAGDGRRLPRHAWLYALVAVFALAMLFLLAARSVEIAVTADSEADVSVSGLALPLGDRYLMRRGDYRLQVTRQNHLIKDDSNDTPSNKNTS